MSAPESRALQLLQEEEERDRTRVHEIILEELEREEGGQEAPGEQGGLFAQVLRGIGPAIATQPGALPIDPGGAGATAIAGAVETGLVQPATGLLQLAKTGFDILGVDTEYPQRAIDFIQRANNGLINVTEKQALEAGASVEEMAIAEGTGSFAGFIIPGAAAVKLASLLPIVGTGGAVVSRWPTAGNIITDSTAGLIFGGAFMPAEDQEERLSNARRESALFGVSRLILSGSLPLISAFRNRRIQGKQSPEEIRRIFDSMNEGIRVPRLNPRNQRVIGELLNEEQYLSSSEQAIRIMAEGGPDEAALVQAIRERGRADATSGVVRGIGARITPEETGREAFGRVRGMTDRLKGIYPDLTFTPVKSPRGDFDVFFGTKGLSNAQKRQFRQEGRFQGQLVQHESGSEYEYVRRARMVGGRQMSTVRRRDGSNVEMDVLDDSLTDMPNYIESPTPVSDGLFRDFEDFYEQGSRELAAARQGVTEGDLIEGIRRGDIQLDDTARRAIDLDGAIIHPEELGGPMPTMARADGVAQKISQFGLRQGDTVLDVPTYYTFDDVVDAWAAQRGMQGTTDLPAIKANFAQRIRQRMWNSVPEEDRALYNQVLEAQTRMVNEGKVPLRALAYQKGFHMEQLPDGSPMLREVNTGAKFLFNNSDEAEQFIRARNNSVQEMPSIIPEMRGSPSLYTEGFPDPGNLWSFDRLFSLDEFQIPTGKGVRNLWNVMQDVEQQFGIPIWSKGMLPVDRNYSVMLARMEPEAKALDGAWKRIAGDRRLAVGEVWREMHEEGLDQAQAVALMRLRGFNQREIKAFTESNRLVERWGTELGIETADFPKFYFGRIRPFLEVNHTQGGARGGTALLPEDVPFGQLYQNVSDLPAVEADPEIVLHRFLRGVLWDSQVKPTWNNLAQLVGGGRVPPIRFQDVPDGRRLLGLAREQNPNLGITDPVVPEPIRNVMKEYLNAIRGTPHASYQNLERFGQFFFDKLGVKVAPNTMQHFVHSLMANQYGALMGLRTWHAVRNMTQVPWLMFPRLGGRHMGQGLDRSLSLEGFSEVFQEGVFRFSEGGIPFMDAIYRQLQDIPVEAGTRWAMPLASAVQLGVRLGRMSQTTARRFLTLYSSSDTASRGWAYHWQKMHTDRALQRFETGKVGWDKFLDEGLPFFSPAIKDQFREVLRLQGRERALRFAGKMASDQHNFIYGAGVQPAWMQHWAGRLLGTFGTWPVWAVENYMQAVRNSSPSQLFGYGVRLAAMSGVFANMATELNFNLWSWAPPTSLFFGGGPYVDQLILLRRAWSGTLGERASALQQFARQQIGISLPGQQFYQDINRLLDDTIDPRTRALTIFMGKPSDPEHWATDVDYDELIPYEPDPLLDFQNEERRERVPGFSAEALGIVPRALPSEREVPPQ